MNRKDLLVVRDRIVCGGQAALGKLFQCLPLDLPAAFVVVSHLYRNNRSELHRIIGRFTEMRTLRLRNITIPE